MARIRTIKPEFWTDEKLIECSMSARLLFIGTWNFADDAGNLDRSAKQIKARVFPLDNIDCEPLLQELIAHGLLTEYVVNGKNYLHICGFTKHQVINRPSKPTCPTFEGSSNAPVGDTEDSLSTQDGREGKGKEGKGEEITTLSQPGLLPVDNLPEEKPSRNGVPYEKIVSLYHECLPHNPRCEMLTATRKGYIAARWNSGALPDLDNWQGFFKHCAESKFLTGQVDPQPGRKRFVANLEWLTKEANFVKIFEGKYHGR